MPDARETGRMGQSEQRREYQRHYQRAYRAAHRDERLAKQREWQRANRERIREYKRRYRAANLERIRERERIQRREWSKANPERARAIARRYQQKNWKRVRARRFTPEYRERQNWIRRVQSALSISYAQAHRLVAIEEAKARAVLYRAAAPENERIRHGQEQEWQATTSIH